MYKKEECITLKDAMSQVEEDIFYRILNRTCTEQNFIDLYHEHIREYENIYRRDIYDKLYNDYKIWLVYFPVMRGLGGCKKLYGTSTYEVDHYGPSKTYEVTETTYCGGYVVDQETHLETESGDYEYTESCTDTECKENFQVEFIENPYGIDIDTFYGRVVSNEELSKITVLTDFKSLVSKLDLRKELSHAEHDYVFYKMNLVGTPSSYLTEGEYCEKYIYFVPIYIIETFDGKQQFEYNAYTNVVRSLDYISQEEYLNAKFLHDRQNERNILRKQTKKRYVSSFIVSFIFFLTLLGFNGYLLFDQLKNGSNYIGYALEAVRIFRADWMILAGNILFSLLILASLVLLVITSVLMIHKYKNDVDRIYNVTVIRKDFKSNLKYYSAKKAHRLMRKSLFPSLAFVLFTGLCFGLSFVGFNRTQNFEVIQVGALKKQSDIKPYYKMEFNMKGYNDSSIRTIEIPEICEEARIVGRQIGKYTFIVNCKKVYLQLVDFYDTNFVFKSDTVIETYGCNLNGVNFEFCDTCNSVTFSDVKKDDDIKFSSTFKGIHMIFDDRTNDLALGFKNVEFRLGKPIIYFFNSKLIINSYGDNDILYVYHKTVITAPYLVFNVDKSLTVSADDYFFDKLVGYIIIEINGEGTLNI